MAKVPGLRSPRARVGRIVYFGRLVDKVRLHEKGLLPSAYADNLGNTNPRVFDSRCCRFLGVAYEELVAKVRAGHSDEDLLAWAHQIGTPRSDDDCEVWNAFMTKLGWKDEMSARLQQRVAEYGLQGRGIETYFELFEADEA